MPRKTDVTVYYTQDVRKQARAAAYIESLGIHLHTKSEMARIIDDTFHAWLDQKGVPTIESTHEAIEMNNRIFGGGINTKDRKAKDLLENLHGDEELTLYKNVQPEPEIVALANGYLRNVGIMPKLEHGEEQKRKIEEAKLAAIVSYEHEQEETLTSQQIERNGEILRISNTGIEYYKKLIDKFKTDKAKELYQKQMFEFVKLTTEAVSNDAKYQQLKEIDVLISNSKEN